LQTLDDLQMNEFFLEIAWSRQVFRFVSQVYHCGVLLFGVLNPSACTSKQCKTTPINIIHIMLLINATDTVTRFIGTVNCEVSDENACRRELLTRELKIKTDL